MRLCDDKELLTSLAALAFRDLKIVRMYIEKIIMYYPFSKK